MQDIERLYKRLLGTALNFASTQARTEFEVKRKLGGVLRKIQKRSPDIITDSEFNDLVERIIEFLRESHVVDDDHYAKTYVYQQSYAKNPKSRLAVKSFLMKKGIAKDILAESLKEMSNESELLSIEQHASKKLKILQARGYAKNVLKNRLVAYLASKGYSMSSIFAVIDTKLDLS